MCVCGFFVCSVGYFYVVDLFSWLLLGFFILFSLHLHIQAGVKGLIKFRHSLVQVFFFNLPIAGRKNPNQTSSVYNGLTSGKSVARC